jgi:RNA polymerase-binding protein DksA
MIDTDSLKTQLETERTRLSAALENLHESNSHSLEDETGEVNASGADNHLGDTASATYERELEQGLEEGAEELLAKIDAALRRIEDGRYGICANCAEPIAEDRLEAMPWATLCIDCKRREERG